MGRLENFRRKKVRLLNANKILEEAKARHSISKFEASLWTFYDTEFAYHAQKETKYQTNLQKEGNAKTKYHLEIRYGSFQASESKSLENPN